MKGTDMKKIEPFSAHREYELVFTGLITVMENDHISRKYVEVRFSMFETGVEAAATEGRKTLLSFTVKNSNDLVLKSVTEKV